MTKFNNILQLAWSHQRNAAKLIARGVEEIPGTETIMRTVPKVSTTCEATEPLVPNEGALRND